MPKFKVGQLVKYVDPPAGYEAWRFKFAFYDPDDEDGLTVTVEGGDRLCEHDVIEVTSEERLYRVYLPGETLLVAASSREEAQDIVLHTEYGVHFKRDDIFDCVRVRE